MKAFMDDEFLLRSESASRLYHDFAEGMPIFDYHCHLPPAEIAGNIRYRNLTHVWLGGDHYKWRLLRANGVPEELITGPGDDWEKFKAWAETIPYTLGNPMYHWTHLELRRFFGVNDILGPSTAEHIYGACNEKLAEERFRARGLMSMMNVKAVCTTDDPADSLEHHRAVAADGSFPILAAPAFRPDKAFASTDAGFFNRWTDLLGEAAGTDIRDLHAFLGALTNRARFFHGHGCRLSDHGVEAPFSSDCTESMAAELFARVRGGESLRRGESADLSSVIFRHLGETYHELGWTMQIHMGAMRNNNSRFFASIGPDTGFDAIGDFEIGRPLSRFLDSLDRNGKLPKTILYVLNPRDNDLIGSIIGCFQGGVKGKVQFGTAWWFNDQIDGMEKQMISLANSGLLSRFLGMVTDSRSFLSYPRHEYFRRILCSIFGGWMERGEIPADFDLVGGIVKGISYGNARDYFGIDIPE